MTVKRVTSTLNLQAGDRFWYDRKTTVARLVGELNNNQGWRGSSNQVVHFLTQRYIQEADLFTQRRRDVEIHVLEASALVVGVPPINFSSNLKQAIAGQ